jgi:acyl transferase domain-containing protein
VRPEFVAIIGMSCRFPHAAGAREFWLNLREGREAVESFKPDQTEWLSIEREPDTHDRRIVRARAALDRPEWFDAAFFQMTPREASIMDPQQRVFLECAWEALENAGCNPESFPGSVGVFAGSGFNSYFINNLLTNGPLLDDFGLFAGLTLNDKDYLATRVAYKLDLRGPAINVQTACSTSLVAVTLACQSLLTYQCDVALAGGVSISFPVNRGYLHVEGGILSADGHCRHRTSCFSRPPPSN